MDKVIRDGKVAVLVSGGYGAGWYSWNTKHPELLFHPEIVHLVEKGDLHKVCEDTIKGLIKLDIYVGGFYDLEIEWIPEGTIFRINEYDGSESLITQDDDDWVVA